MTLAAVLGSKEFWPFLFQAVTIISYVKQQFSLTEYLFCVTFTLDHFSWSNGRYHTVNIVILAPLLSLGYSQVHKNLVSLMSMSWKGSLTTAGGPAKKKETQIKKKNLFCQLSWHNLSSERIEESRVLFGLQVSYCWKNGNMKNTRKISWMKGVRRSPYWARGVCWYRGDWKCRCKR